MWCGVGGEIDSGATWSRSVDDRLLARARALIEETFSLTEIVFDGV